MHATFLKPNLKRVVNMAAAAMLLGACNVVDRVADIGSPPELTKIENPVTTPAYNPVTLPMPRQRLVAHQPNSLWRPGSRAFFKDQRARQIGDILTVNISIADEAAITNETTRTRSSKEDTDLTNIAGFEGNLNRILPNGVSAQNFITMQGESKANGKGSVDRKETIKLNVAAIVTQVLPNGNFVIMGSQEVRVNFEKRILNVSGVIRPEDISAANTVSHTQIAEARISYGGAGQLTDVQQARYGQQLFDVIFPF
jgi:flagellar L-ring protein precursor FlgH